MPLSGSTVPRSPTVTCWSCHVSNERSFNFVFRTFPLPSLGLWLPARPQGLRSSVKGPRRPKESLRRVSGKVSGLSG